MMDNVFEIIILVYYLASVAIIISDIIRVKNNRMSLAELIFSIIIILLLPIMGVVIISLFRSVSIRSKNPIGALIPEIHFEGIRSDILYKSDPEKEKNIVPMEEALIINNNQTKRTMLIEALKRDFLKSLYFIQKAIRDQDTETSHYAASALMELKDNLTRNLRKALMQYNIDQNNTQYLEVYASAMKQIIESDLNSEGDQESLSKDYIYVLEQLIQAFPNEERYYQDAINYLLQIGYLNRAELFCARYLQIAADSETPYFLYLKTYYFMEKQNEFMRILRVLQSSNVRLSSYGINILRFWLREGEVDD